MDREAWWAIVYRVTHNWTGLQSFTFHFHALKKEMATQSSILAWKITWTEDPGRLQYMGLQSRT